MGFAAELKSTAWHVLRKSNAKEYITVCATLRNSRKKLFYLVGTASNSGTGGRIGIDPAEQGTFNPRAITKPSDNHRYDRWCQQMHYRRLTIKAPGRALSAFLCRELTNMSPAELSKLLGLGYPDSSANLVRKARKQIAEDQCVEKQYHAIMKKLIKTKKQG
jgi:hypothetical protein